MVGLDHLCVTGYGEDNASYGGNGACHGEDASYVAKAPVWCVKRCLAVPRLVMAHCWCGVWLRLVGCRLVLGSGSVNCEMS